LHDSSTVARETDCRSAPKEHRNRTVEELIDRIDDRTGSFVVTVRTESDETTLPLTESAGADTYSLFVVFEENGDLIPLTTQ